MCVCVRKRERVGTLACCARVSSITSLFFSSFFSLAVDGSTFPPLMQP